MSRRRGRDDGDDDVFGWRSKKRGRHMHWRSRARGQRLFGEAGAAKTRKDTAGRRAPTWARPGSRGRSSVDADPLATLFLFSGGGAVHVRSTVHKEPGTGSREVTVAQPSLTIVAEARLAMPPGAMHME